MSEARPWDSIESSFGDVLGNFSAGDFELSLRRIEFTDRLRPGVRCSVVVVMARGESADVLERLLLDERGLQVLAELARAGGAT